MILIFLMFVSLLCSNTTSCVRMIFFTGAEKTLPGA
jgi:hypothetical protein